MQLHKTNLARAELQPGVRTLGQRERTLLLLADGSRSAQDFHKLFDGDGEKIALRLLSEGFLERQGMPVLAPVPQATDQFEGKRSLATARMFLFDLCERMFVRRNPEMAAYFRVELRNAKDAKTMLASSRQMLEHIEREAGHERADAISQRLAMLLPSDAYEDAHAPG